MISQDTLKRLNEVKNRWSAPERVARFVQAKAKQRVLLRLVAAGETHINERHLQPVLVSAK